MKENRHTKKSLKASGLALLLCIAMLIGTTFAWFTDSITNSGNKIEAGSLDIGAMAYDIGEEGMSVKIEDVNGGKEFTFEADGQDLETSKDKIINETLWEPGKSNAKLLQVTNNGTLAAKIKVDFSVEDGDYKRGGLQDALWFDFVMVGENGQIIGTFEKRPMSQLTTIGDSVEIPLLEAGENVKFVLIYGMNEDAGNNYQKGVFSADVSIIAKQEVKEADGFGNNKYDGTATYPVGLNSQFEDVMTNAKPGDIITVAPGSYKVPKAIGEGVTITGEGKEKTKLEPQATEVGEKKTGILIDKPGIKISNAYINSIYGITSDEYHGIIDIRDSVTLDSLKFQRTKNNCSTIVINNGFGVNDIATISNSEIVDSRYKAISIVDGANGTVNIVNSEITSKKYTLSVNSSSSKDLVINVENSKLHGWTSYGNIKFAKFTNTEFSKGTSDYDFIRPYANTTWDNCTFDAEFKIGAGAVDKTYILNNCIKNGTTITAENIKSLNVLDMSDSDGENLKKCTIIVNGKTISL